MLLQLQQSSFFLPLLRCLAYALLVATRYWGPDFHLSQRLPGLALSTAESSQYGEVQRWHADVAM